MALQLTAENKVFIACVAGYVVLFAGYYLGLAGPGKMVPGAGPYPALLLAAAGLAAGGVEGLLQYDGKLPEVAMNSGTAGAAAGILTMLASAALGFAGAAHGGLAEAAVAVLAGVVSALPSYALLILALALPAAIGGTACRLALLVAAWVTGKSAGKS